ncbi:MAG: SH3 domain-containing protein [Aggregatilineales bacterium]
MRKLALFSILFSILLLFTTVQTFAQTTCPATVLLSVSRSGSACFGLERNQVCYGNGTVSAQTFSRDAMQFIDSNEEGLIQPGDVSGLATMQRLQTSLIEDGLSVALAQVQSSLTDAEQRTVGVILFGDAQIENLVTPLVMFRVSANGTINIRAMPDMQADILERLTIGDQVTVIGRNSDEDADENGDWLRVRIPATENYGWIPAEVASANDPIGALAIMDNDTPVYRPFEVLNIQTGSADRLCEGAPESGVLMQAPNSFTPAQFILNGAEITLFATVFLQSTGDQVAMYVLDGEAEVDGVFIPAGTMTLLDAPEPLPYSSDLFTGLPINILTDRIQIAEPLTPEGIIAAQEAHEPMIPIVEAQEAVPTAEACSYRVIRLANLWSGPGMLYEVINEISAGASVFPVLETRDSDGDTWWQLSNSNWIRAELVDASETCGAVPFVANIPAPTTNILSMEDCRTRNGPLRDGQRVTIEFTPPAFDGLEEARAATRIDPGTVTINERRFSVSASDPIVRGGTDDRYFRIFRAHWEATPGTYRIVSGRLTYILICNLTVPVGG